MTDWQIALIASGSALLGTLIAAGFALWGVHIQTKRARELEDIRRIREVREKRIDKVESLLLDWFEGYWYVLEINKEENKEEPDRDNIDKLKKVFLSKHINDNLIEFRLLDVNTVTLNDTDFMILANKTRKMAEESNELFENLSHKPNMQIEKSKLMLQKLDSLQTESVQLFSHIYDRLDYLRTIDNQPSESLDTENSEVDKRSLISF